MCSQRAANFSRKSSSNLLLSLAHIYLGSCRAVGPCAKLYRLVTEAHVHVNNLPQSGMAGVELLMLCVCCHDHYTTTPRGDMQDEKKRTNSFYGL